MAKIFGSWKEVVALIFRKDNQEITLRPNQSTTYTAARDMQSPPQDADSVLVSEDATQTVSNKSLDNSNDVTIQDTNFTIQDDGDNTKQAKLEASSITTATTRTYTLPDADTEVVGNDATQTLTNKTIDADNNTISNLAHGAEVDDPSSGVHGVTGNVVGTSDSQTLTNKTIDNTNSLSITDSNLTIEGTSSDANFDADSLTVNRTFTLPDTDTTVAGTDASQTLTNKTIDADNNTISNLAHGSEVDNPTSGVHGVTGNVVGTSDTQTLTNKTLQEDLVDNFLDFNEESVPANPSAGTVRLFAKTDGLLYSIDDGGLETLVSGGSGGGGSSESVHFVNDADYTITDADGHTTIQITASTTDRTVTLPTASDNTDRVIRVKHDGGVVGRYIIVAAEGSDEIDNDSSITLYRTQDSVTIQSDGSDWMILNNGRQIRNEVHSLGSNVTSTNSNITDLRFDNLISGQLYRITVCVKIGTNSGRLHLTIEDSTSGAIARIKAQDQSGGTHDNSYSLTLLHEAVGSSIIFNAGIVESGAVIYGDGSTLESYSMLEELPRHVDAGEW